ncbi:deoR-like helix-turn-helix domain protein [Escherichia coli DEC11D]|nr:deoR-like helix-turn-helix domain protein [Escherichia coli DEC11D]
MKQTQRHNGIIELVKQQGYVSTEELVEHFSVSPQTIRRDLNELAEQNLILRHHGGAALPSSSVNTPWHDRKATQTEEKERIARKVAEQIPNGSTVDSIGQRNSYVKTWGCGGFLNETNIYSRGKSLCF